MDTLEDVDYSEESTFQESMRNVLSQTKSKKWTRSPKWTKDEDDLLLEAIKAHKSDQKAVQREIKTKS